MACVMSVDVKGFDSFYLMLKHHISQCFVSLFHIRLRSNISPYCFSRGFLLLTKVMVITIFKMYLYTAMRWVGTFIAVAVIILLQMFVSVGSLLVKEYVYSEIDWGWLIFCTVLSIAGLLAVYFLMKTKFYVIPLGKVMFCLYAIISIIFFPNVIGGITMVRSAYEFPAVHNIVEDIIDVSFIIIETLIFPILPAILAFIAERKYKIKKILSHKE